MRWEDFEISGQEGFLTTRLTFWVDDYLPAILTAGPKTGDEFAALCSEHPDLFFAMSAERDLIVMPPTYTLTGARHRAVLTQLDRWAQQDGRGIVTDAGAGFVLPNGARRSPDVAWTLNSRVRQLDLVKTLPTTGMWASSGD